MDGEADAELTGWRRGTARFACGALAAIALVAMLGMLFGHVQRHTGPSTRDCIGKGDTVICGDPESSLEWHPVISSGGGVIVLLLTATALVVAVLGMRGGLRRGIIVGLVDTALAFVAAIGFNVSMWGDFLSFRGDDAARIADVALVAMFLASFAVLVLTLVLASAERRHRAALEPSIPEARTIA